MPTLGALYREIKEAFRESGLETPDLDAKLLLSYALGCAPQDVILKPDTPVTPNAVLDDAVARRLKREPVSKITGTRGFYGLEFEVRTDVLDPRPDTETLVDAVRKFLSSTGEGDVEILDICTGTGCIPLALLSVLPHARALGVDISPAALRLAQRNAEKLGLAARMTVMKSNWAQDVTGRFDIITCNPPYIPSADIDSLAPDVRHYDPILALDGGKDGLDAYRIVFPQIRTLLRDGGMAFFEIGAGQAHDIARLAADCGLRVTSVVSDLGGIERVVCLQNVTQAKN